MTAKESTTFDSARSVESIDSTYHLKWIPWNTGRVPIVMQRVNGPCPLIAIMNVLLLREKVKPPSMLEQITAHQLMTYLGECIMDSVPADLQKDSDAMLNLEQNIHDAMEILPKLQTGLDVNVRFSGISDFEYTPECIIFDLLRIPLYHGWLSDPNLEGVQAVVGNLSYNQLVDSIITNKASPDPEVSARAFMAEDFLDKTASQLTTYGLRELRERIKDNELGVLFRNNHFITLFKREGTLYQLVTDHGFLTENIVWETLDNIEGDGKFADSNFEFFDSPGKSHPSSGTQVDGRMQQLENDFLMALSLAHEEESQQQVQQQLQQQLPQKHQHQTQSQSQPQSQFQPPFQAQQQAIQQAQQHVQHNVQQQAQQQALQQAQQHVQQNVQQQEQQQAQQQAQQHVQQQAEQQHQPQLQLQPQQLQPPLQTQQQTQQQPQQQLQPPLQTQQQQKQQQHPCRII